MTQPKPLRDHFPNPKETTPRLPPTPEDVEAFCKAAMRGHVDTLREMLEKHDDSLLDARDNIQACALTWAAFGGHDDAISTLLTAGAKINAPGTDDRPAIAWAAEMGKLQTVNLLLESGADPSLQDSTGKTARDLAEQRKHKTVLARLDDWVLQKQKAAEQKREAEIRATITARQQQLRQTKPDGLSLKRQNKPKR